MGLNLVEGMFLGKQELTRIKHFQKMMEGFQWYSQCKVDPSNGNAINLGLVDPRISRLKVISKEVNGVPGIAVGVDFSELPATGVGKEIGRSIVGQDNNGPIGAVDLINDWIGIEGWKSLAETAAGTYYVTLKSVETHWENATISITENGGGTITKGWNRVSELFRVAEYGRQTKIMTENGDILVVSNVNPNSSLVTFVGEMNSFNVRTNVRFAFLHTVSPFSINEPSYLYSYPSVEVGLSSSSTPEAGEYVVAKIVLSNAGEAPSSIQIYNSDYENNVFSFLGYEKGVLDGVITTPKIADSAVTSSKIAGSAVTTSKIADSAITSDKIASGAVTENKIAGGAVTSGKISSGAVNSDKLASNAVISDKIASNAVTSGKIADGAITDSKLASNSVTENKILQGAVTSGKIADGSVTTNKIQDNAISTAKITDEAVTGDKIKNNEISSSKIKDSSVVAEKIADGAITEAKIANPAVSTEKIFNEAVTTVKIAENAVTFEKIENLLAPCLPTGTMTISSPNVSKSIYNFTGGAPLNFYGKKWWGIPFLIINENCSVDISSDGSEEQPLNFRVMTYLSAYASVKIDSLTILPSQSSPRNAVLEFFKTVSNNHYTVVAWDAKVI